MTTPHRARPRLMLLFTTTGYEAREFVQAAQHLGVDTVLGSDRCHVLNDPWQDGALPLRFERPQEAAQHIVDYARSQPLDAILPIGDTPVLTAALANQALHFQHHDPRAAAASRNKFLMRQLLRDAGLRVPWFASFPRQADPRVLQPEVPYPCVLKPLGLSGSRGVIRANDPARKIDRRGGKRSFGSEPRTDQLQSGEQECDHRRGKDLEEPFDPQMHNPPSPIFNDGDVGIAAVHQPRAVEQRDRAGR